MAKLTLENFEEQCLDTLLAYAAIPALSPAYDENWKTNGHLDSAMSLLVQWAKTRELGEATFTVHQLEGRTPLLFIEIPGNNDASGTAMLYGHMDKQPPLGEWSEGLAPFTPVRRENRIYARGVADDGYAIFSSLLAIEELVKSGVPRNRMVVLIEASEESGSPDLLPYLDKIGNDLGDVELLICLDSGALTYDRLWVTTSLRGVLNFDVTVHVLEQGQHSGSASGVVPSSFRILRQLLDRLEDATTGEVLIEELHTEIPASHLEAAAATAEEFGDVTADELPLIEGITTMGRDAADRILNRTWRPTLSVTGVDGIPNVSIAGNVLRPYTSLTLSFRLPPTVNAARAREATLAALRENVPSNARLVISADEHFADGWLAPELSPWLKDALDEASVSAFGREPGFTGEGGSIPFLAQLGERFPGVQFVATGVLGPHSNAHGIDEMLDLDCAVGVTNAVVTILEKYATKGEK